MRVLVQGIEVVIGAAVLDATAVVFEEHGVETEARVDTGKDVDKDVDKALADIEADGGASLPA